jgi:predicted ArsR family transcriptional regulator
VQFRIDFEMTAGDNVGRVEGWQAISALVDPSRRALFDYVRRQDHPVSREEAADAQRMSRNLAAFHLDKLVEAGLLNARYEAPSDQPRGRGRTPKVYEPAHDMITVTIPQRRYELIAEILAAAVADEPTHADVAAARHAHERGRAIGAQARDGGDVVSGDVVSGDVVSGDVVTVLASLGFEPEQRGRQVLLHNCPFHALAAQQTELVCGLSLALVGGLIEGLAAAGTDARLVPRDGACCVELTVPEEQLSHPQAAPG